MVCLYVWQCGYGEPGGLLGAAGRCLGAYRGACRCGRTTPTITSGLRVRRAPGGVEAFCYVRNGFGLGGQILRYLFAAYFLRILVEITGHRTVLVCPVKWRSLLVA